MTTRVRFAPSPTGYLHIGGARTALFNWLYAKHTGGKFILRIEDTDVARNTPEALQAIFGGLKWLGLDWDEGPMPDGSTRGNYGPYFQSQRIHIYRSYVERLLSIGKAYTTTGGAIKFRMKREPIVIRDLVVGNVTRALTDREQLDPDFVIVRSDGQPVFHLVNVVDDLEMKITHVIRGEDHLTNTAKHIALFEALNAEPPAYAHIPLILNANGSKMSKRDEGASLDEYIEEGYLPQAMRNFLCLLGWSSKDNREILSLEEIISKFDLPQIHRHNSRFDREKCFWLNGEYMRLLPIDELSQWAKPILDRAHIPYQAYPETYFQKALATVREKIKIGKELPQWMAFYFTDEFPWDEGAKEILASNESQEALRLLYETLTAASKWSHDHLQNEIRNLTNSSQKKIAFFVHPLRVCLTGRRVGPSLYALMEVLGKEQTLKRIKKALCNPSFEQP
ncbi:MAG: glutamate--tRNA ligase [Methylacidiphilales bacterium]|nr:glutamate--tRNA ligase [Candidatus Methylacidiphilales bacterium]MDW8349100.1 glutamate--tRNA ligase family protein [Verrucomicrobiae bacterium]